MSESRFPKLLKVQENRKKLWKDWKSGSRAQGRCATGLRYAPTLLLSLDSRLPSDLGPLGSPRPLQNCSFIPNWMAREGWAAVTVPKLLLVMVADGAWKLTLLNALTKSTRSRKVIFSLRSKNF